jgi:hypothetical protein
MGKLTQGDTIFGIYGRMEDGETWLWDALLSINEEAEKLGVTAADFENPDAEWVPIPIDQNDPAVAEVVDKLTQAVEEIRADNGYSATLPQERDHVLEGLSGALEKFKSPAVSAGWVRVAFERLKIAGRRFGGTLKEATIKGAQAALVDFVKRHMGEVFDFMIRHLPF